MSDHAHYSHAVAVNDWDRLRAFACYRGRCECGWRGPGRYYPWEAQADEAAHRKVCAIINLDLRRVKA